MKQQAKKGEIVLVNNADRPNFSNSKTSYYCVHVEDEDNQLVPLLFTLNEYKNGIKRASKNLEDVTECVSPGLLSKIKNLFF